MKVNPDMFCSWGLSEGGAIFMTGNFRLALCQMKVESDKEKNIFKALKMLQKAADGNADIAVLPEMFNCPYDTGNFTSYAETADDSPTLKAIAATAKQLGIYVFAGSIPEKADGKIYNTSFAIDRKGSIIGRHRKMHLFDIDVTGRIRFMESDILSRGDEVTIVETEFCKVGMAICYDIRFPELSGLMALEGAELLVLPGAFNMVTGPAHWEILIRARALDNQFYVAAASPARDMDFSYKAYGNSMAADPWGNVLCRAGEGEEIVFADISASKIERVRNELPLLKHRRTDLYSLKKI